MRTESNVRPELVEKYPDLVRINYDVTERKTTSAEGEQPTTMYEYRMLELKSLDIEFDKLVKMLETDKYPTDVQISILSDGTAMEASQLKDFKYRCRQYARQILSLPETEQTKAEDKQAAVRRINAETDYKILTGFTWMSPTGEDKGVIYKVWLSEENQHNYSEAQRVTTLTGGTNLPVTFKMGEDENGNARYHTFTSVEEMTGFYLAIVAFVQECLEEGWKKKDELES